MSYETFASKPQYFFVNLSVRRPWGAISVNRRLHLPAREAREDRRAPLLDVGPPFVVERLRRLLEGAARLHHLPGLHGPAVDCAVADALAREDAGVRDHAARDGLGLPGDRVERAEGHLGVDERVHLVLLDHGRCGVGVAAVLHQEPERRHHVAADVAERRVDRTAREAGADHRRLLEPGEDLVEDHRGDHRGAADVLQDQAEVADHPGRVVLLVRAADVGSSRGAWRPRPLPFPRGTPSPRCRTARTPRRAPRRGGPSRARRPRR